MTMVRIGLSWTLYWTGDLVSRTIVGGYFEWPYWLYSRLMVAALNLQGDDPRGPWSPTTLGENGADPMEYTSVPLRDVKSAKATVTDIGRIEPHPMPGDDDTHT